MSRANLPLSLLIILFLATIASMNCQTSQGTSDVVVIQVASVNPTYFEFCITSCAEPVVAVEIYNYDWDTSLESPNRQWFQLIQAEYDPKCWYYQADKSIIYAPASLRFTGEVTGRQMYLNNIVTSTSQLPLTLRASVSDRSDITVAPVDVPLTYALTPSGNVSAYNAAATHFEPTNYACMLQPYAPYNDMYAAIRVQDWKTSQVCGQCLALCNSTGHSVEVMVVDQCPFPNLCTRHNWLDISPKAFNILSNGHNDWGVQQLTWRFVECSGVAESKVTYVLEDWSKSYGFALQVRNFRLGLKSVAIQSKSGNPSGWVQLVRSESNYFFHTIGTTVQCPCRVKLVSIINEEIIDENAFISSIETMPKNPSIISGTAQFTQIPPEFQKNNGKCVPFSY